MPVYERTLAAFRSGLPKRLTAKPLLTLFAVAFLTYNLNLRPISSGDTAPAALLPFAVLFHHTVTFDPYVPWFQERYGGVAYFFHATGGRFYSKYPVGQPVLLTPLYLPLLMFPGISRWSLEETVLLARVLEKLIASLVAACSVAFFFVLAKRLAGKRNATLLTIVYAFASSTWSISSQALWQHGMSELTIILSLLCLDRFLESGGRGAWVGAGLFAALSVAARPTDVLFLAASCLVVLSIERRRALLASYALFGALVGSAVAAYNLWVFGVLRGGYSEPLDGDFWAGLSGLLLSPAHGLFVFSPVFLFVIPSLFVWLRNPAASKRNLYMVCLLFVVGHLLLYSNWAVWWGGDSFGPRLMTDVVPCLTLLLIPGFVLLQRSKPAKVAFAAVVIFSIFVQFVGAFSYPRGDWDHTPMIASQHPERFWDWVDNPIRRAIGNGINLHGYRLAAQVVMSEITGKPANLGGQDLHIQ